MSEQQQPSPEQQLANELYALSNNLALAADPQLSSQAQTVSDWADQVAAIAIGQRTAQYVTARDDLRKRVDDLNGALTSLQNTVQAVAMFNQIGQGISQFLSIVQNLAV